MKQNTNTKIEELNEKEISKGLKLFETDGESEEKGRYITIWCSPRESSGIILLKMKWKKMGLDMPFSKVLRLLMNKGMDNIEWKSLLANPTSLFTEAA